jgi:hypothetical protein
MKLSSLARILTVRPQLARTRLFGTIVVALLGAVLHAAQSTVEVQGSVEVLNEALRTPYHKSVNLTVPLNIQNAMFTLPAIPSGKRLVIKNVSVHAKVVPGETAYAIIGLRPEVNGNLFIPMPAMGTFKPFDVCIGNASTHMIFDQRLNQSIFVEVVRSGSAITFFWVRITGYLEDAPAVLN